VIRENAMNRAANVQSLPSPRLDRREAAGSFYLGPAEVLTVAPDQLGVKLRGEVVPAQMALAFVYEPAVGDTALVVGDGTAHYVIGILNGSGKTRLELPGDVNIHAQGTLRLSSEKEVEIKAPTVKVATNGLDLLAGAVVQRFRSLRQRVTDLVSLHAGSSHTLVEGSSYAQSKSATILTEEKVTINGREVHLG
jgi:hypothetical protein